MKNKINEIAKILSENYSSLPRISVKDGKLGAALFLSSYGDFSEDEQYSVLTEKIVSEVLEDINNGYVSDTLGKEMADLGIFLSYMKDQDLLDTSSDELLNDLDVIASDFADKNIEARDFDPFTGFLAQGYYLLNRDTQVSREAILKIVKAITFISIQDKDGHLFWKSPKFSNGGIYTGITHGSCAIIQFLLKADLKYKFGDTIKKLLVNSIEFLMKHKLNFEEYNFYFPTKIGEEVVKTPVEWCYGDLSIGYTLLNAGLHLKDELLERTGIEILENTVKRTDPENYIDDASLSYGSAGIAIVLKKALLLCDSPVLQTAYHEFIHKTLKQAKSVNEFAGYQAFFYKDSTEINLGFMTGLSGIGLAFLAHMDEKYLPFTRFLYL